MRFEFNRTGVERKALVQALGEILGVKPRYLGMPTAAYEVGCFRIDRIGAVESDDRADKDGIENLMERLAARGIVAASVETAQEGGATEESAELENQAGGPETAPQEANVGLTVVVPADKVLCGNLTKLLEAKGSLIKKALGIDDLRIEIGEEKVSFPWFAEMPDADAAKAYTHLISALCEMSRNQKRITATKKKVENEKYAFRCFLLRLGFIGAEYKGERKILLKNLSGSAAFKNGERKEAAGNEVSE